MTTQVYYKNNPDGSIRWIWPRGQRQPLILKFYSTATFRARLIAALIRCAFRLRLQGLFASGKGSLALVQRWYPDAGSEGGDWALFTGTAGVNQTALYYCGGYFYKVPVGVQAQDLVRREFQSLEHWQSQRFRYFGTPECSMQAGALRLKDLGSNCIQTQQLTDLHWAAIVELSASRPGRQRISELTGWKQLSGQLLSLQAANDERIPNSMLRRLFALKESIDTDLEVPVSDGHGDFTPWNIFVGDDRLQIIDWELSQQGTPLFFDAFHFIYQREALLERKGSRLLLRTIEAMPRHPIAAALARQRGVDLQLHHKLYLLFTTTYYLLAYVRQSQWQQQMWWSIGLWNDSLNALLADSGVFSPRQLLVLDVFDFLHRRPYLVLKWTHEDPVALPEGSDIDMHLSFEHARELRQFLKQHPMVRYVRTQRRSFMRNMMSVLRDGSLLSIDTIWTFKRKAVVMLNPGTALDEPIINAYGVKMPLPAMDFNYTWLFYLLNGAALPERYKAHFGPGSKAYGPVLEAEFSWKHKLGVQSYADLLTDHKKWHGPVVAALKEMPENRSWQRWKNVALYAIDALRSQAPQRGMVLTFSGVDGAGKSTIIAHVREQLEKCFRRKVVVLRHRPSVLPMLSAWKEGRQAAESRAASTLPRQGTNGSILSSLLRFGYYYTDYLLGQFVVQIKYVWRGYVVLYDRYYFDFINDARRSNISLHPKVMEAGYHLLLKPRMNVFLYASAETILERKKELDAPTIRRLTRDYLALFRRLRRSARKTQYLAVNNKGLNETLDTIYHHLQSNLS